MSSLTIDIRLINNSGIGTYIQNLIPLIVEKLYFLNFNLIVNPSLESFSKRFYNYKQVKIIPCSANLYTLDEQHKLLKCIPGNTRLFWSPHYVIPYFYSGQILVTVHDTCHLSFPESSLKYHKQLYAKIMFHAVEKKSTHIITVSNFSKQEIKKHISINDHKITVIHNGVSGEFNHFICNEEQKYDYPYIVFVGNVKPNKNLLRLLIAFEKLIDKIPHTLLIVGKKDGFISSDPAVFSYSAKLSNRVKFTGFVDDFLLKQIIHNASVLIFPSLYEGFGLPPLEAMASGCPVAVSNAASMPEICGDAALYFDPYDPEDIAIKIYRIVTDKELAQSLIQLGKYRVQSFTWDSCANKTCEVIENQLSKSKI